MMFGDIRKGITGFLSAVLGLGFACAQEVPTPPMPGDEVGEVEPLGGGSREPPFAYTEDIATYVGYDWVDWNTRIRDWFDAIGERTPLYPPLPKGFSFYLHEGVEVLCPPFVAIAERVEPIEIAGVPTWTAYVSERVAEDGTRSFETLFGTSRCHQIPVSQFFDPKAWSRKWYGENGALPHWLANESEEAIQTWYDERGRERFGFSVTFVPAGQLEQYKANLAQTEEEERQRQAEQSTTEGTPLAPLRFTAIAVNHGEIALSFHNETGRSLGLLAEHSLSQASWSFLGTVQHEGNRGCAVVALGEDKDRKTAPHFFRLIDLEMDTDGDRLPDLLETYVYKTDPLKADTSGSGMSDWEKIFVHGLDATTADSDGDGLLDGEEVKAGTSPFRADTDGDGLTDLEECAPILIRQEEAAKWFESEAWTELYPAGSTSVCDNQCFPLPSIDFPVALSGTFHSTLTVDTDGNLVLHEPSSTETVYSLGNNSSMAHCRYKEHAVIAGYWDDLAASIVNHSKIRYAKVQDGEDEYLVVEYLNVHPYRNQNEHSIDNRLSFQIAIRKMRQGESISHVYVNYREVGKNVRGDSATIGLKCPRWNQVWQYTCNEAGAITSNMTLVLVPGPQTSPLLQDSDGDGIADKEEVFATGYKTNPNYFDTDGDGLGDNEEIKGILIGGNQCFYLNPLNADCDGDDLPDGWEVHHGLNPLAQSAYGDFDGDGLSNMDEYLLGTKPNVADTDNDGLSDGMEVGHVRKIPLVEPQCQVLGSVFSSSTLIDDEVTKITLPKPIVFAGKTYTSLAIDTNGIVYFLSIGQTDDRIDSKHTNHSLLEWNDNEAYLCVAIYWDDLKLPSSVAYGECVYEGKSCFFVEYGNIRNYHGKGDACIRLIVPYDAKDTLIVQYPTLSPEFDGSSATLGALQAGALFPIQFSHEKKNAISAGEALQYTLGTLTDPKVADSDGDGLCDGDEVLQIGSNPLQADSDGDGLTDQEEAHLYHTNPNEADSDGDGWADDVEVRLGLPPLDDGTTNPAASPTGDWDGDGLSNAQEIELGYNPSKPDSDGDGLLDGDEVTRGTNPLHMDSDGDDLADGWEVTYGFDPLEAEREETLEADPDNDGLTNLEESFHGTNPYCADTDGDGVPDNEEVEQGTNPIDPFDKTPPKASQCVTASFSIYGDYAAWEMQIQGQGKGEGSLSDNRLLKHHMKEAGEDSCSTFQLRQGCSYKVTMQWLKTIEGQNKEWYCWSAQVNGMPEQKTYDSYNATRKEGAATIVFGEGFWAENDDGLLCEHTHMDEDRGGNVAGALSAMVHIPDITSPLVPDYQRDLAIDAVDTQEATNGVPLNLWINDDDDGRSQDYAEKDEDIPGASHFSDATNKEVDGVSDLLDFFPIHIDAQALFAFLEKRKEIKEAYAKGDLTIRLSQADNALNLVWTSLTRAQSGAYLTQNIAGCGEGLDKNMLDASLCEVTANGIELPEKFIELLRGDPERGVVLVEGRKRSTAPLVLGLYHDDDVCVWKTALPLNVLPVEEMYGRINLRSITTASRTEATLPHNPSHPNVLFLHGFNVSENAARGWHAEMFKRLYQSGTEMNFYGVTWRGDEALTETVGIPALHYHLNVYNAFKTAPALASAAAQLPQASQTSVLAHSLGNMVVSEAICSYGFKPDNTILLNAAIPAEAFDASLQDAEANKTTLVPQDWRDYDSRTYASRWNELFSPTEPQSKMKWAGLFENIAKQSPKTRFYNFYSSDDEVFELRDNIEDGFLPPQYRGTLHWELEGWAPWDLLKSLVPETTFSRYAWQKQEFLKGTHAIFGTADGGWAFDLKKVHDDLNNQDRWVLRYTPEEANSMLTNATSRLTLKHTPVFSATPSMLSPNAGLEKQRNERYEILAYRIPALSPAMGSIPQLKDGNNEIIFVPLTVPTVWPRTAPSHYKDRWLHSDIKNMAFFYSFDTVQNLCKAINGNEVKQ